MRFLFIFLSILSIASCQTASSPSIWSLRKQVGPSIVRITIPGVGKGSGFVAKGKSGREYVVTNAHVCGEVGATLFIEFTLEEGVTYVESAIDVSLKEDLCIVSLHRQSHAALPIGKQAAPGNHIFVVGHPLGKGLVLSEGSVIDVQDSIEVAYPTSVPCGEGETELNDFFGSSCLRSMHGVDVNASTYPGNSGGPLINESGEVVGIVFASGQLGGSALNVAPLRRLLSRH